ncbi:MAG: SAM-dependent methyltransferase [Clostridia bacterium]|nr:SAM-dependent methyltransferase [Clostridia bacterium]
MNDFPKLTPRLACASKLIRASSFVADIGTDHAYLPIYLCLEGKARGAVASDINAGPVERAEKNINKYGLSDKITVLQTDGLNGIQEYRPTDIMILGMGGELISRIIEQAPWTKDESIQLCLQPMTHAEILREFLTKNGYSIVDERLAQEEKIYQIILAKYTGLCEELSEAQLLLGKINAARHDSAFISLAKRQIEILKRRAEGKKKANEDLTHEQSLIAEIKSMIGETT